MNENYTAEDFARANVAMRSTDGVARRVAPESDKPWRASWIPDFDWLSDEDMAADGWMPVRVANGRRDRDTYIDHIADQDRVIRRRNDEIAALRRELADAQAPLSLDDLAAAWEAAEQADECRAGDVLIIQDDEDNYLVRRMDDGSYLDSTARILSRSPREPWQGLADDLADRSALMDEDAIEAAAKALHVAGWRKGGDE